LPVPTTSSRPCAPSCATRANPLCLS
jgi:hypothetical protein